MSNFCKNCGNKLNDNIKFCTNCGEEIIVTTENNTKSLDSAYKSKITAGLFGIFLGSFGVHNFYLGYNGKAVAQLLLTVLTCGMLSFVSSIWGLIEGILILTGTIKEDAEGKPLGE